MSSLPSLPSLEDLVNVEWRLVTIDRPGELRSVPAAGTIPSVTFTTEVSDNDARRLEGNGGCNRFFGSYVADADGNLSVPGPLGATKRMCPGPIMNLESALFSALGSATTYEISDDALTISFDGGTLHFIS